jgi:hypothetical protein
LDSAEAIPLAPGHPNAYNNRGARAGFLFHQHKERFDVIVPAETPVYVVEATRPVSSGDAHA